MPAVCTIISRNYLSHARILAASFQEHHPGSRLYLLVVDELPDDIIAGEGIHVIHSDELQLPYFTELCFKYDVTELSTALKPTLLKFLLDRQHEDEVMYLDPDIFVLRRFDELLPCVETANIVLMPHLLDPIPLDGLRPRDQDILVAGAYNLGFIAVRNCETTQAFLEWWQLRLKDGCFVDFPHGLMTDQKWIDLVPGLFGATVFKDETYNVAYWNIHSRRLERQGSQYFVNGRPLTFFHFSGFDAAHPLTLSKYQNRTQIEKGTALSDLIDAYIQLHFQNGFAESRTWQYRYGYFDNGVKISVPMRRAYWTLPEAERASFADAFRTDGEKSFLKWATDPASTPEHFSPFMRTIYGLRPDLAAVWPDIGGQHRAHFLDWTMTAGPREFGYDPLDMRVQDNVLPSDEPPSGNFETSFVTRKLFTDPNSTDGILLRLVGSNKRVLELGCGGGHISQALREQECEVVAIEVNAEAARHASAFCERVIRADLDYFDFDQKLGSDRFDVVMAEDVLEHLKDPASVLRSVSRFLRPGGYVVLSVPNIAHLSVRVALLAGKFPYAESGLLDRTHLRFFTRDSVQKLLHDTGFAIGHFQTVENIPADPATFEVPYDPQQIPQSAYEALCREPGIWDYQFVLAGYPLAESGLAAIQDRMKSLSDETDRARKDVASLAYYFGTEIEKHKQEIANLKAQLEYQQMVQKMRDVMREVGPKDGNVLVISKGDDDLLLLSGCRGLHFPQNPDGGYAGYYPLDSAEAIQHLEEVRQRGAHFLFIPQSALWWFEHYPEFTEHLDRHYSRLIHQPGTCVLFDLTSGMSRESDLATQLGLNYGVLVPVAVSAIEEQQATIEKQRKRITELQEELQKGTAPKFAEFWVRP
jgi:2-polyprenyl-3-methyl-5-hydroxy-6-metoxy-1,4-benzoquinol methylase